MKPDSMTAGTSPEEGGDGRKYLAELISQPVLTNEAGDSKQMQPMNLHGTC